MSPKEKLVVVWLTLVFLLFVFLALVDYSRQPAPPTEYEEFTP